VTTAQSPALRSAATTVPAPRQRPIVAVVLGLLHTLQRTFDNKTPTTAYDPKQTIQVDDRQATGYLNPNDADGDTLTYSAHASSGGTVDFDPATPGKFTYTAPATAGAGPWTDTVTVTTSDAGSGWHLHGLFGFLKPDGGSTTTTTMTVTLAAARPPDEVDPTDGTVTGAVYPSSNEAITYSIDPNHPLDPKFGTVALDRATGEWTFTPTAKARTTAYTTLGPDEATFTLLADDGQHQTPVTIHAVIDPTLTAAVPVVGTPALSAVVGADGSVYQVSFEQDPDDGSYSTYVTVLNVNGATYTNTVPIPGRPNDLVVIGTGVAVTSYDVTYPDYQTWVTTVTSDGISHTSDPIRGLPGKGPLTIDGTNYQNIYGDADETDPAGTRVVIIGPDGIPHVSGVVPGRTPQFLYTNWVTVAGGMTYLPTGNYVGIIAPDGTTVLSDELPGFARSPIVVVDGVAYQATMGQLGNSWVTYLSAIDADGDTHIGDPIVGRVDDSNTVISDGVAYQSVWLYDGTSQLYAINPDGTHDLVTTFQGHAINAVVNGDTVYQLSQVGSDLVVTIIDADGNIETSDTIPGSNYVSEARFTHDGLLHLTTSTTFADAQVSTIAPDGTTVTTHIPGYAVAPGPIVDGFTFLTTYTNPLTPGPQNTYVTVLAPDGTTIVKTQLVTGTPPGTAPIIYEGVYYQSFSRNFLDTRVAKVDVDGNVLVTEAIPGRAVSMVANDGTIYLSTVAVSGNAQSGTYMSTIGPDFTVHTSDLIPGTPTALSVAPDGTVYLATTAGLFVVAAAPVSVAV
jgi:hypothetical protein